MTESIGPVGSPERAGMEERANAWFYGEILRGRRKELKMSQAALAEKVGVKQSYIAESKKGRSTYDSHPCCGSPVRSD